MTQPFCCYSISQAGTHSLTSYHLASRLPWGGITASWNNYQAQTNVYNLYPHQHTATIRHAFIQTDVWKNPAIIWGWGALNSREAYSGDLQLLLVWGRGVSDCKHTLSHVGTPGPHGQVSEEHTQWICMHVCSGCKYNPTSSLQHQRSVCLNSSYTLHNFFGSIFGLGSKAVVIHLIIRQVQKWPTNYILWSNYSHPVEMYVSSLRNDMDPCGLRFSSNFNCAICTPETSCRTQVYQIYVRQRRSLQT